MKESMVCGAVMFLVAGGCAAGDALELGASEHALACPVPAIDAARSLAVTDPTVLAKFRFHRVMNAIMASANATNNSLSTYRAWMDTFGKCLDPQGYGMQCPRTGEAALSAINPFATTGPRFVPVALTNRFDLAPTSGANCGEYRIVFALVDGSDDDRAFLIFEGRLPNPTPTLGLDGCAPVADLWASLSTDESATSRASKLEQLYFTGLVAGGITFAPVVAAQSYGLGPDGSTNGSGQLRTNMIVTPLVDSEPREWNLREFKLGKACPATDACELSVQQVKVKNNPANEVFAGTHPNSTMFLDEFPSEVAALSSQPAAAITMSPRNVFNEFESVSQRTDVVYRNSASAPLRSRIQGAITNPALTVDNILDRATTQTCAGCHWVSNNRGLGDGVTWPSSLGFVHIDESGTLSSALTQAFLPRRAAVLSGFLQARCNGSPLAPDDGLTLSGAALDAPN